MRKGGPRVKPADKRYPPHAITTVCVPWDEEYRFQRGVFAQVVEKLVEAKLPALYLFGTAGEGYAVDEAQYLEITRAFLQDLQGTGVEPMVGVISLSASDIIRRIGLAAELGVRDFQISFPSWGMLSDEEAYLFFHQVCDPFPSLRFMHYNNGGRSKKLLNHNHYARLAQEIPNLAAVKYMNDSIEDIISIQSARLPIQFILSEYGYGVGALYGECGMLFSSSVMCPKAAWALYEAGRQKDVEAIVRLEQEIAITQQALFRAVPQPIMNAGYDKMYTKALLPGMPLRLYPPYLGPTAEQYSQFAAELKQRLPHWSLA